MDISTIITIVTSVGGTLGLSEIVRHFIHRHTENRKEEAEADSSEFAVLKEVLVTLQEQLREHEERFDKQTDRLREVRGELFELMKQKSQVDLDLQKYRCIRPKCQQREPQNGY